MEQMLEQAEAVLRFSGEVQRRMSEVGVEGIGGVMGLYAKLRSALERVSHDELDWAASEVTRVLDSLNRINDELKRLKALVDDFADRIDHKRCSTDSSRNFANLVSAN